MRVERWVWRWSQARETLLALSILTALAFALSRTIPQAPTQARSDPAAYNKWLSTIPTWFRERAPLLSSTGLFRVDDTPWFRFLLAALAFVTLISLGNRVHTLLRLPARPRAVQQPDSFYDVPGTWSIWSTRPPTQVIDEVQRMFHALVGASLQETRGERTYLYSSRPRWARATIVRTCSALSYLGLLLLACGVAVDGKWGWHQRDVQVLPGKPVFVGPAATHEIQMLPGPGQVGQAHAEAITLQVGAQRNVANTFALNRPFATCRGMYCYQSTGKGGPLVQIKAQDRAGNTLTLHEYTVRPEPAESLQFAFSPSLPEVEADRLFIVSDARVVGRLQWQNRGPSVKDARIQDALPRFHLWVFHQDGQTPVGDAEFAFEGNEGTVTIGDVSFAMQISRYAVLNVSYHPGFWLLASGSVLLIAGLLATLIPRREMWASIHANAFAAQPGGSYVQIRTRTQGWTPRLGQRQRAALADLQAELQAELQTDLRTRRSEEA